MCVLLAVLAGLWWCYLGLMKLISLNDLRSAIADERVRGVVGNLTRCACLFPATGRQMPPTALVFCYVWSFMTLRGAAHPWGALRCSPGCLFSGLADDVNLLVA